MKQYLSSTYFLLLFLLLSFAPSIQQICQANTKLCVLETSDEETIPSFDGEKETKVLLFEHINWVSRSLIDTEYVTIQTIYYSLQKPMPILEPPELTE